MSQWPKSITAVVHINLTYDENGNGEDIRPDGENESTPPGQLQDRLSNLDPYMRQLVIRFAEEIRDEPLLEKNEGGQSPD